MVCELHWFTSLPGREASNILMQTLRNGDSITLFSYVITQYNQSFGTQLGQDRISARARARMDR